MPGLLRQGTLVQIYKQSGNPSLPTNNRPICLISVFRKLISTALTGQIKQTYNAHVLQWGFRDNSGTEGAIAFAVNKLRLGYSKAVILDLKKTYDLVPRCKLQDMVDLRFPPRLARNIRTVLWTMLLKTTHQHSLVPLRMLSAVPQYDSPSPYILTSSWTPFM